MDIYAGQRVVDFLGDGNNAVHKIVSNLLRKDPP